MKFFNNVNYQMKIYSMWLQSDEGKGLGSWTSISFPQQLGLPSPALVQSISVPHTEQRYLFPS